MEILAPAGSIAALKAAIKGGADAVYLGLGEHNARLKSNDFNLDNLTEWVAYAHLFGVKVYVTLNTAIKEEEMDRALTLAEEAGKAGADALIVSDLGLAKRLSDCSDIPLHLSTQAGVQNSADLLALKGLRIKRVILARETPVSDFSEIKKHVEEVEVFAQGAICVSFSGGCLLGSKMYDCSGNRGLCNQACRLSYTATDAEGRELARGKLLSPADLSYGEAVLSDAFRAVDSIKIEGRLKRPFYVYAATKYYRHLLDGEKDLSADYRDLEESFNRGFTKGYSPNKSAKIINAKTSSHLGVRVGNVVKVEDRQGYKFAHVTSDYPFEKGDGAKILRDGIEVGGSDVTSVRRQGNLYVIPVSDGVRKGDVICLTTPAKKVEAVEHILNKLPIFITLKGRVGTPLELTAQAGNTVVSVQGDTDAQASNSSDNSAILEKLSKVGGTDFELSEIKDETEEPLFVHLSELNNVRRRLLAALKEKIIKDKTPVYHFDKTASLMSKKRIKKEMMRVAEVSSSEEIERCASAHAFVLTPNDFSAEVIEKALFAAGKRKCYLRFPKILREKEITFLKKRMEEFPQAGIYADNLYSVGLARTLSRPYIAGFGLNIFNEESVALYSDADWVCASTEYPYHGDLVYRAGKVPLMSFAHCPVSVVYKKECSSCDRSIGSLRYQSGDLRYLILRRRYASCDFTMYEDKVTRYPPIGEKSCFYSLIGLNRQEKDAMIEYISEDICE